VSKVRRDHATARRSNSRTPKSSSTCVPSARNYSIRLHRLIFATLTLHADNKYYIEFTLLLDVSVMKNPISALRSWLDTATTPSFGTERPPSRQAQTISRRGQVDAALSGLPRRPQSPEGSATSAKPAAQSGDAKQRLSVAREAEAHDGLRKAFRAGSDRSSSASGTNSPRASAHAATHFDHRADEGWGMAFLRKSEGRQALHDMIWDQDFSSEQLNDILARSPDLIDSTDHAGETLLLNALNCGNVELAKVLLAHGADLHARDERGNTPLHQVAGRDTTLVRMLLDAGADPGATNNHGATPLFYVSSAEAAKLLLDAGAPVNHRDGEGNSAVMRLVQGKSRETVLAVLAYNPDLRPTNVAGHSFAQILTTRFGGVEGAIPKTATGAKAFIELVTRESDLARKFRDDAPRSNATRRAQTQRATDDLRIAPERRLSSLDAPASAKRAINNLPSGHKIDLVADPLRAFDELSEKDVEAISEALGFGKLATDHPDTREQQRKAIRHTFSRFANELDNGLRNYDNSIMDHPALSDPLSPEERMELTKVMDVAHIYVAVGSRAEQPLQLRVLFGGTQNTRDLLQDIGSGFGRIGDVDRAAKRAGELFVKLLKHHDSVELDFITGLSMGGAMAQTFRATIESTVLLPKQPSMILLDPQLLNNNQARRATKGGTLDVDFSQPRGAAITLDYAKDPHRGLMGIMKGVGRYRYPGLVQLKLGLTDTDGAGGGRPQTSGPPGLGYHANLAQFSRALARFSTDRAQTVLDAPAINALRAPRWAKPQEPLRMTDTLPAIARLARSPMEPIAEEDE